MSAQPVPLISELMLRKFLAEIPDAQARVHADGPAFVITFDLAGARYQLGTALGNVRRFAGLNFIPRFLAKFGILTFTVDSSGYSPGRVYPARPDQSEALRSTRRTPKQEGLDLSADL